MKNITASYTLPGLYSNNEAQRIKEVLDGKTFYEFEVQYGGTAENNQVTIITFYEPFSEEENFEEEFKSMIISFIASSL